MPRGTKRYVMTFGDEKRLQCTRCNQWKKFEWFRLAKRQFMGRDSICKACRTAAEQSEEHKAKNRAKVKRTNRRHKLQYKQGELFYQGEREAPARSRAKDVAVNDEEVQNAAARALALLPFDTFAAEMIGVDGTGLRKIANGQNSSVTRLVIEALAKFLEEPWLEDKLLPPWNKAGDKCCRGCGTNAHPHRAKGLCRLCYHRDYYGMDERVSGRGQWATYYVRCQGCGTTDRKHDANGYCTRCTGRIKLHGAPITYRTCICGCGQRFELNDKRRLYATATCKDRVHRQKRRAARGKGGPDSTTPGSPDVHLDATG